MIIKAEQAERFHEKTKEAYWQNTLGDLINYLDHSLAQFEPQQYMIGGHHLTLFPAAKRKKNTVENIRRLSAHLSEFECFSQTKRHAALNRSQ
jgi:hypothetical protein